MGCLPLKTLGKGVKRQARARAGKPTPRPRPIPKPKRKIRGPSNKKIREDYANFVDETDATGRREASKEAAKEARKSARLKNQKNGTDWNPTQTPTGLFVPNKMEDIDSAALRRDWRRQQREDKAREREECQRKKREEEQREQEERDRAREQLERLRRMQKDWEEDQEEQEEQAAGFVNLTYRPKHQGPPTGTSL